MSAKLRAFQHQFFHRILYTNYTLFKCGVNDSAICLLCKEQEKTFIHYLDESGVNRAF